MVVTAVMAQMDTDVVVKNIATKEVRVARVADARGCKSHCHTSCLQAHVDSHLVQILIRIR